MVYTILYICNPIGGLAQLARALAWHARGRRFDPDTLHEAVEFSTAFLFNAPAGVDSNKLHKAAEFFSFLFIKIF